MSRWQPESWCLAVGEQSSVLAQHGARTLAPASLSAEGPWGRAVAQVWGEATAAGHRPRRLQVIVAGALAQHWSCRAPQGTASLRELRAYAGARRAQQFGDAPGDGWWVEADWRAGAGFACMAVPHALVTLVGDLARAQGAAWTLSSDMALLMANPLLRSRRRERWVAVETPQGGLLWHEHPAHGVSAMRGWRRVARADDARGTDTVQAEWLRARLRADGQLVGGLAWLRVDEHGLEITEMTEDGAAPRPSAVRALPPPPCALPASWPGMLAGHGGCL